MLRTIDIEVFFSILWRIFEQKRKNVLCTIISHMSSTLNGHTTKVSVIFIFFYLIMVSLGKRAQLMNFIMSKCNIGKVLLKSSHIFSATSSFRLFNYDFITFISWINFHHWSVIVIFCINTCWDTYLIW